MTLGRDHDFEGLRAEVVDAELDEDGWPVIQFCIRSTIRRPAAHDLDGSEPVVALEEADGTKT